MLLVGGGHGLYAYINGQIRLIADTNTPIPGTPFGFADFGLISGGGPAISGENIVFMSAGSIYGYINGSIVPIATPNIPAPGSSGGFGAVSGQNGGNRPSIDGQNIAFTGGAADIGIAIFGLIDGEYCLIANRDTPVPGTGFVFGDFGFNSGVSPSISGKQVVFHGFPPGGIYLGNTPSTIPAVSTWGWITLMLLLMAAGTVLIRRQRAAAGQTKPARG